MFVSLKGADEARAIRARATENAALVIIMVLMLLVWTAQAGAISRRSTELTFSKHGRDLLSECCSYGLLVRIGPRK